MILERHPFTGFRLVAGLLLTGIFHPAFCQTIKPGLPGMASSKWISVSNTHAPKRSYQAFGSLSNIYTQEDFFFKFRVPVLHKPNHAIVLTANYRTEQLEYKDAGDNPLHLLSSWNLRSIGVDLKSVLKLNTTSWLISGVHVNQSGNLRDSPKPIPLNYTFSTLYLEKKSDTKEVGMGIITNIGFDRVVFLPVLVFNYTYSSKGGIEISLPRKIAWRYNLSSTDILYIKSETAARGYYIYADNYEAIFRRTDIDNGIAYNKQINKLIGVEAFGGYRVNIGGRLPQEVVPVKQSGFVFSVELFCLSPFK